MRILDKEVQRGKRVGATTWGNVFPSFTVQEKIYNITSWSWMAANGIVETQQPTKNWVGAEEKRIDKRDKHGGVAEGCQCTTPACGGREMVMQGIINNRTLLHHDAEHHDPNMTMMASKIVGEPDLV
jgi:hypothetical protein